MMCSFPNFNFFFVTFFVILQIQDSLLQTNPQRSQKRAADSNAQQFTAAIICLHGLGDTGNSSERIYDKIREPYVKLRSPTAPIQPVSIANGSKMTAWFDIRALNQENFEDNFGIEKSTRLVHELIQEEEEQGIPASRIVIAGFSQGAALALYSALSYNKKLAGIVALSGWVPISVLNSTKISTNRNIPIFQGHGNLDTIVPYHLAELTSFILKGFTSKLLFKTYPGLMHHVSPAEMLDVKNFLRFHLPQLQPPQTQIRI